MTAASSAPRQIPLDLGHRIALGREDYLVAPCNQDAVGWIDRWPDWNAPALILHGPAGSGKTHLAAVWKNATDAAWIDAAMLAEQDADQISRLGQHVVIDHLEPWIGDREAETTLFHLYNLSRERGTTLLVTTRTAPGQVDFTIADLSSRLRAAPAIAVQPPDDTLLAALLVKLFSDRQLQIGADAIAYVVPRMERSYGAACAIVARADKLALAEKKPVSIALLRRVLSEQD